MRKIMKVAIVAAVIAAPIEVRAQTIDTAVTSAYTLGEKVGGLPGGIVSGTVAGFLVGLVVIAERLLGPPAAETAPAHAAPAARPKAGPAPSRTKTANLGVSPQPRYEGRSIAYHHSRTRRHHA